MSITIQDKIEREITVRAPKERVYSAIANPDELSKWFPDAVEGKLEPGQSPIFNFGEYGKAPVYIVAAEPYHYFAYRWRPGQSKIYGQPAGEVLKDPNTLVEFRLEEVEGGTKVKLTESGFASLSPEFYEGAMTDNSGGWTFMMERLAKYLE